MKTLSPDFRVLMALFAELEPLVGMLWRYNLENQFNNNSERPGSIMAVEYKFADEDGPMPAPWAFTMG